MNDRFKPKQAGEIAAELKQFQLLMLAAAQEKDSSSHQQLHNEFIMAFRTLENTDPAAAFDFVISTFMMNSETYSHFYLTAMEAWGKLDPDGALLVAKDIEDEGERLNALSRILPAWQIKYPDRSIAESIALDSLSIHPDEFIHRLNKILVSDLALRNSSHALKFAKGIEDPKESELMVFCAIGSSVRVSPTEAIKAVAGLPDGIFRDHTTGILANEFQKTDFQQASALLDQITSDEQRHQAIDFKNYFCSSRLRCLSLLNRCVFRRKQIANRQL